MVDQVYGLTPTPPAKPYKKPIEVIVKDTNGNLVPNQEVRFTTTLGTLAASGGKTDMNGKVTINLLAPTIVGQATVTASTESVSRTTTVTFATGSPAFITTIITPTTAAADGKSIVSVYARATDAFGNPIVGQLVNFTTSLGSIQTSAQTDAAGVAVAPLTASASAGIAQVTASLGALQSTANASFVQTEHELYLPLIQH